MHSGLYFFSLASIYWCEIKSLSRRVFHGKKVVELKNVTKKYGSRTILDDIDFSLYEGDVLGLIGQMEEENNLN